MDSEVLDQLQHPVGYPAWMWIVPVVLLLVVAAWFVWMHWWLRRKAAAPEQRDQRGPEGDELERLRASFLAQLEELSVAHAAGELDLREVHLRINHLLRDFATARGTVNARPLTARELALMRTTQPLANALEEAQEPAFAPATSKGADAALATAAEVVRTW